MSLTHFVSEIWKQSIDMQTVKKKKKKNTENLIPVLFVEHVW